MHKVLQREIDAHFQGFLSEYGFSVMPGGLEKGWISERAALYLGPTYRLYFGLDPTEDHIHGSIHPLNPRLPGGGSLDAVLSYLQGKKEIGQRRPGGLVIELRQYHDAIGKLMSDSGRNDYLKFEAWLVPIVAAMKKQREESGRTKKKWWQFW